VRLNLGAHVPVGESQRTLHQRLGLHIEKLPLGMAIKAGEDEALSLSRLDSLFAEPFFAIELLRKGVDKHSVALRWLEIGSSLRILVFMHLCKNFGNLFHLKARSLEVKTLDGFVHR
jgi:hypothetical protein